MILLLGGFLVFFIAFAIVHNGLKVMLALTPLLLQISPAPGHGKGTRSANTLGNVHNVFMASMPAPALIAAHLREERIRQRRQ